MDVKENCNFELFNIPKEDYRDFEAIARRYRGNSFAPALREMIVRYYIYDELANIRAEIKELREMVEANKPTMKVVKTMNGGRLYGKIRQDESETKGS